MNVSSLKIPYAIAPGGVIVFPDFAQKNVEYICPECGCLLIYRCGSKVSPHFAHKDLSECRLNGETWLHVAAKYAVCGAVLHWLQGGQSPVIERLCTSCHKPHRQQLPDRVRNATIEHRVHSNTGVYVADVALLDEHNNVICVIEVRHTHAVDEQKEDNLGSTPWVEIDATESLRSPFVWHPLRYQNLKGGECARCREAKKTAIKMPIIRRGMTLHVDHCPMRVRVWQGKPYANVFDDCFGCPARAATDTGIEYNEYGIEISFGPTAIYCSAGQKAT